MNENKILVLAFSGENGAGKTTACRNIATDIIFKEKIRKYFDGDFKTHSESFAQPLKEYLLALVGSEIYKEMSYNTDTKDQEIFSDVLGLGFSYRNFLRTIAEETRGNFSPNTFAFFLYLRLKQYIDNIKRSEIFSNSLVLIDDLRFPEEKIFLKKLKETYPDEVEVKYVYLTKFSEMVDHRLQSQKLSEFYREIDKKDWIILNNVKGRINLIDILLEALNYLLEKRVENDR